MKIVLTGATGFIGNEVLQQCLAKPAVTSVVALSRRPLDSISDPKLKVVVLKDFTVYDEDVLKELEGAEACIWNLGITPKKNDASDPEHLRHVSIDYTLAAARAFTAASPKLDQGRKFRFVYTSGFATERDQDRSLWMMNDYRKLRGDVENKLIEFEAEHPDNFEAVILKPGGVLRKENPMPQMVVGATWAIKVNTLSACMVDVALNGRKGKQTLDIADLEGRGRAAL